MPAGPRFIGVSTWMSRTGSRPNRRGMRFVTSSMMTRRASSASRFSTTKKSELVSPASGTIGGSPALIRCAFCTMRLFSACRKIFTSRTHGTTPESIASRRNDPGPTLGQLIDVADEHEPRAVGDGLRERVGHPHVDHRALVDDDGACLERVLRVALERVLLRLELEQAMERRGLASRRLAHALRCATGRRSEPGHDLRPVEHAEDRLHDGRLADARAAGDDEERAARRLLDGETLLLREHGTALLLERGDRLGEAAQVVVLDASERAEARREAHLRLVHRDVVDGSTTQVVGARAVERPGPFGDDVPGAHDRDQRLVEAGDDVRARHLGLVVVGREQARGARR